MAKLGHPWAGTAFRIPSSKLSAEATGGWVSCCSMHNFFDGCRGICCVAATKGNERKGIHLPLKKTKQNQQKPVLQLLFPPTAIM